MDERALKIDQKVYGPDHPNVATDINKLGGVLRDLGDLRGARRCFERALKAYREKLGDDHFRTKIVMNNLNSLGSSKQV